jgi:H+/gluconate symporter-like permease
LISLFVSIIIIVTAFVENEENENEENKEEAEEEAGEEEKEEEKEEKEKDEENIYFKILLIIEQNK